MDAWAVANWRGVRGGRGRTRPTGSTCDEEDLLLPHPDRDKRVDPLGRLTRTRMSVQYGTYTVQKIKNAHLGQKRLIFAHLR